MSTPTPHFVLRAHSAQISALVFSTSRPLLVSGDVDGWIAVWSLHTLRPILFWKAHKAGVLTVDEWSERLITHGRDHAVHVFALPPPQLSLSTRDAPAVPSPANPAGLCAEITLPTKAIAYCKCSLLALPDKIALIATPATLKDDQVDIFHLPSGKRVFRGVGGSSYMNAEKIGSAMSIKLFAPENQVLSLLVGYEDGRIACYVANLNQDYSAVDFDSVENTTKWSLLWWEKGHREPIMSMAISPDNSTAWSVAADHYVSQYFLNATDEQTRMVVHRTRHPGRADVAIRGDGRIIAIAGWDGITRVYSTKTFKPLATLQLHKESAYALAFAPIVQPPSWKTQEDTDDWKVWLCIGSKDTTLSLWHIYPIQSQQPSR